MSRAAQRRQCNSANLRLAQAASSLDSRLAGEIMAARAAAAATGISIVAGPLPTLVCGACGAEVFTLVAGQCFRCGRPVEGKNLHDMTTEQYNAVHECGLPNKYHCDGWDGNWLDCEEANLRRGYLNTRREK